MRTAQASNIALDPEMELINDMGSMSHDPLAFVYYAFPWGQGELAGKAPEQWQIDLLTDIRDGLKTPNEAIQEAVASGHGIGKSALVAWLILWSLSTFEDTRGVVTANTDTQLRTKTWPELSKWYRMFIAKHWFVLTATAIYSVDPEHEKNWRIDLVPWSRTNTEAFAGLHNKGKRIILIFDEASAIEDMIWEVSEGALTDEDTEILWFAFGNPTRNTGRFHACFHKLKHRWKTRQIDSRSVSISNKKQLAKWEEDYGPMSDFFKIRVTGEFPNSSVRQFIGNDIVEAARGRKLGEAQYNFAAKIIGVDPAWSGEDEIAIVMRQGLGAKLLGTYRKLEDDFLLAQHIAKFEDDENADAVFVDFGMGTGVVSAGKQMKRKWVLVPFGGASTKPAYLNKRAEMWGDMKDWLKGGGAIPNDPVLCEELVGPEYDTVQTGPNAGKIVLESKEDMKNRGIASPNRADALAITFAYPVRPKRILSSSKLEFAKHEYDPLA